MPADAERANTEHISDSENASLAQRIKAAKEENADNKIGLCFSVCGIFLGTLACQIISLLFTILPIAMIYFGATNLHNCTINSFIPIYLLVQGICTLLDQVLIFCQCRNNNEESETNKKTLIGRLFDLFVMVWFIVGSIYVYKIYEPNYNKFLGAYCDKTTYLFAFWSITLVYGLAAILIFVCCCICVVMCCAAVAS